MSHVAPGLVDTPQTYSGTLNGKIVFTSGGHGWRWSDTLGRYATDRGDNNEIVEDFGNQEQMSFYADYLLRGGATVVPMRPVGRQINEVVLDNDSAGVTFTGTWSNSTGTQYYDENYNGDAVPYRFASTTAGAETSVATYTPNIPQAGFYPVYAWAARGANRTTQLYRINHTGGLTEIRVDHRAVGFGWVYLGTYHFDSGSSATEGSVQISNNSSVSGVVIADAIRFGNGMGDWVDTTGAPGVSGYPREDENSFHWIARSVGIGTSLTTATGAASDNNVSAPSNFAQHMYSGAFGGAVYVGFHSNAGGGRGARGLIDSSAPTPHQAGTNGLADILGDQINQDMQNLNGVFEFNWTTGTTSTFTSGFGEINLGAGAEMDATIIEVAFHDSVEDAAIMRDPKGRDQIARSTYQGTVQYFSLYGSPLATNTSLPTPPTNVRAVSNASGAVTLNWAAGVSTPTSVHGAAATGYMVYASVDGYGFDGGRAVAGAGTTTLTITGLDPNLPYYFKVAATNAGGESAASEVVAALPSGGDKQVLIVSGFDRYDRTQNFRYDYLGQQVDRVWPRWNNSFDYINRVERAIQAAKPGIHVASTSNEAVISGAVNLTDYEVVIWILGNESTVNDTFNATEQTKVTQFLAAGGNLFVSGAEIAWDLDQQNNGRTFYENTLKGNYIADDAATYTANVSASPGIFSGLSSFAFSSGASSTVYSTRDDQVYDVATPDVIAPQAGAANALTYSTSAAGIQVGTGGIGTGSIVMFGFPIETMTNETRRQQALGRILDFLGAGIGVETAINGQDADSPTGPILATGSSASITYVVTNTGIVPLGTISVVDDNGTPGNTDDDFNPTFSGGDTNSNNLLDQGEAWTYTATRTVVAGQTTRSGKATGTASTTTVNASDPGNYFGASPAVGIETQVDGQDADAPPGPTLAAGSSATLTYVLTNTGNVPLSAVSVTDDNGTPGNTADDFNPPFSGGDTNSNNQLDIGETWVYSGMRTVGGGPNSNTGTVVATGNAQLVMNSDLASYFGAAPNIHLDSYVDGQDADTPTGPTLAAGNMATFTYDLTNTGNIALGSISVVDDNGTPGNSSDDFSPAYSSGDANSNSLLDLGETWIYTATRTVTIGQYTGIAVASGQDSISQQVSAPDLTHYLGVPPNNADFNEDTIVDTADYILWRMNNGLASGATHTQGDANNDGAVNDTDYNIWRSQFGTSPAGSGAGAAIVSGGAAESTLANSATSPTVAEAPASAVATSAIHDEAFAAIVSEHKSPPRPRNLGAALATHLVARFSGDEWQQLLTILSCHRSGNHRDQTSDLPQETTETEPDQSGHVRGCRSLAESNIRAHFVRRTQSL
jgi:hypothetical protein